MNDITSKTMLQQISDVAWLVHQGNQKLGILNKNAQERFTYITGKDLVNFKDDHEVEEYFGNSTGPYKSELEMRQQLKRLNKEKRNNDRT